MFVVKIVLWSELLLRPSCRIVWHEVVKVTRTDLVGFLVYSVSESEDEDEDDDEELARRAFLVVVFLDGGWLGLFLPSWSLSEKRSALLSPIEIDSEEESSAI